MHLVLVSSVKHIHVSVSQTDRNSSYFHQGKKMFSCFVQLQCFYGKESSAPINRALMTALPLVSISSDFLSTIPHKTGTPG